MKEEDSELSDDLAENTQVQLLVIVNSTSILFFGLYWFVGNFLASKVADKIVVNC